MLLEPLQITLSLVYYGFLVELGTLNCGLSRWKGGSRFKLPSSIACFFIVVATNMDHGGKYVQSVVSIGGDHGYKKSWLSVSITD